jgi:hypothetical protein
MTDVKITRGNIILQSENSNAVLEIFNNDRTYQFGVNASNIYQYTNGNEIFNLASNGLGADNTDPSGILTLYGPNSSIRVLNNYLDNNAITVFSVDGGSGAVKCVSLTQTSLAESKKNFEKLESKNALDILKNVDIYKYNFKFEEDTDKKHFGFVIGDDYNYSKEITSKTNDGVDIYSMVSVLWQVVKEQQEEIEKLKEMINNG